MEDEIEIANAMYLFNKFKRFPTTVNNEEYRAMLGAIDGKNYWIAYNRFHNTQFPTNVETVRDNNNNK